MPDGHAGVNHNVDQPLTTWAGGRYAQRADGTAAMFQRHSYLAIGGTVNVAPEPDPGVEGADLEQLLGWVHNTTGQPAYVLPTVDDAGAPTFEYYYFDPVTKEMTMSDSSDFSPTSAPVNRVETDAQVFTQIDPALPEFGRVRDVTRHMSFDGTTGAYDPTLDKFYSTTNPPVDITADVAAGTGFSMNAVQQSVLYTPSVGVEVTGAAPVAIPPADICLLYTSPSPRDQRGSRMPSSD